MALQVADRVQVTSTSYTTSSFTLGSALTGFQGFTTLTSGNTTYYAATDTVGNWEVGYGTYTTGALARTTILSSSNSGSVVTFSGTVSIFITYPAEKVVYQDANGNVSGYAINGGTIDNTVIGGTTPSTGTFTTITGQTETLKGTGQNFVIYSQTIGNSSWVNSGTATSATNTGATTDPLGGNTATLITSATDVTLGGNNVREAVTGLFSSATYTASVYFKLGTATTCSIAIRDASTGITTTATTTTSGAWVRVSVTASLGTSSTRFDLMIGNANGTFYAWGAQLEIGSVANTYISTTTAAVYGTPTISFNGASSIGLQSDGSVFVQPAGTGALQAQQTTSSATGGNARGANAVDWQTSRTAATMVASAQAVIAGGQNNTSSGTASSSLGGYTNLVNANYATAIGGSYGTTRGVIGLVSIPASNQPLNVTTAGSTQSSMLVIGVQTTNATATALKSNTSAASATNQLVLPNGQTSTVSVYTFRALVSAHNTGTTDAAGWEIKGVISRGAAAANTALVGTPSVALLGATSGAISAGWGVVGAVAAVADTTNGALQIQVTGAASTTINWSATIETNELGY